MRVKISKKELPSWVTVSVKSRTPLQKYLNFVYEKILNFSKEDQLNAIDTYKESKKLHPTWESSFNEFFTDRMIEVGYSKSPTDVENKTGLTYREIINAFYYKAYPEYHNMLDLFEKERIQNILSNTDERLKSTFLL